MSKHTNNEPEWIDFRIENLETTNEHHDLDIQPNDEPNDEDNDFPNNDDDYTISTTSSSSQSQTLHTPSTISSRVSSQNTPINSIRSTYQSDSGSTSTTASHSRYDHSPFHSIDPNLSTRNLLLWVNLIQGPYSSLLKYGEVLIKTDSSYFEINCEVKSKVVSPETAYATYLVFKLPQDQSKFEAPLKVMDYNNYSSSRYSFIYLVSPPHTPVIGPKLDENTYNPLNRYKGNAIPQQRTDGWMEVKVCEFQTTTKSVPMRLNFEHIGNKNFKGLRVKGIELRPI
ncbi:protein kinase domain, Nitrogen network kinase 1, Phloem protein 2-like protein [Artemisia annua]|uniref:Protein kinase domain, Nitrogen network kinase 1, Phloem protein 2-like protein n=1 Tax=Artemisia annua TaxID=35608 RepID=A0A2U1P2X1_ARTAN|nr:protein kinase domain, Nitrogen network kinase 1, Phloem protein 2-like protein [Artemisia annua]